MYAAKIVMALLTIGAVSFAAPVEKREADAAPLPVVPAPAMLGPYGLKVSSSSAVATPSSDATSTVTVLASSTPEASSTPAASGTVVASSSSSESSSISAVVSSVPVPTTTLATVANVKIVSTSASSSSRIPTNTANVKISKAAKLKPSTAA